MSYESLISARHTFRDNLKTFVKILECLDTDSLELLMARIADQVESATNDSIKIDLLFKGKLVKTVYDERIHGARKRWNLPGHRWWELIKVVLPYPEEPTVDNIDDWFAGFYQDTRRLS